MSQICCTAQPQDHESAVNFERQLDVIDPVMLDGYTYTVIGAGGIGSPTVQELAHLGAQSIKVYDFDRVEAHNIPTQKYRLQDIGESKVDALQSIVRSAVGSRIVSVNERFEYQIPYGIVISAVDSMVARKTIWNQVREQLQEGLVHFYIEARMAAELARIFTLTHEDVTDPANGSCNMDLYTSTLYSDEEALQVPCTAKATTYCTSMIAALVTNQVKRFVTKQETHREIIFDFVTMTLQAIV